MSVSSEPPSATTSDAIAATAPVRRSLVQRVRGSSFGILGQRDFGLFWAAALISSAGSWMQMIAVPALMYEITGSATWVGAVSTAGTLPTLFLTPYAGVLADRVSPRPFLGAVQLGQMTVALALYLGYQTGDLDRWPVLVLIALNGCANALLMPAWMIFLPQLVPPERLPDAVRLNSMQFTAARIFGPTTAAVVIALGSLELAFLLNALSFVAVLGALAVVRPRHVERPVVTARALAVFVEGVRYVAARPSIRVAVMVAAVSATLGMSLQQQAASVASELYDRPSTDNAGLVTASGIGSVIVVALVVSLGGRARASTFVVLCTAVYAVGSFTMVATDRYGVGLVGYALNGFASSGTALTMNTTVLTHADPRFRGRAISFYLLAVMAGIPLGAMGAGLVADHLSMRVAVLGMATLMVVHLVVMVAGGATRRLDEPPSEDLRVQSPRSMEDIAHDT
jgi:MFS family permease